MQFHLRALGFIQSGEKQATVIYQYVSQINDKEIGTAESGKAALYNNTDS